MIPRQFELVRTADQSPSFQRTDHPNQETMHHRGGAYSETQYIYGDAVRFALKQELRSFVSVGLGLGYNELLVACESIKIGLSSSNIWMVSYETVDQLKADFLLFIQQKTAASGVYDDLLQFFMKDYGFTRETILNWLNQAHLEGHWILADGLGLQTPILKQAECCLFDAFSSKTTPDLWTEEFLKFFMEKHLAQKAIFSTYARTGNLKRSLVTCQFQMLERAGFAGRRESTLAVRGL